MCRTEGREAARVAPPTGEAHQARCKFVDEYNSTNGKCSTAKTESANTPTIQRYVCDHLLSNNAALAAALDTAYPWSTRDADGMISKRDLKAFLHDDAQRQNFSPEQVKFVDWLYKNWDTPEINQFKNRNLLSTSLLHDAGRPEVALRQKQNDYNLAAPLAENNYALFDALDTARQSTLGVGSNATVDGFITRGDLKWFLNNPELSQNFSPDQLARVKRLHDNWYSNEVQRLQENGGITRHSIARAVGQGRYNPLQVEPLPPEPSLRAPASTGETARDGQATERRASPERHLAPRPELQVEGKLPTELKLRPGESLFSVAKDVLAARTGTSRHGNDEIFRECNRIMTLNGFKDAGLEGKKNITSADLPAQWNNFREKLGGKLRIAGDDEDRNQGDNDDATRRSNAPKPFATPLKADADEDAREVKARLEGKGGGHAAAMAELKERVHDAEMLYGKGSEKYLKYAERLSQQLQKEDVLGELSARWAESNARRFSRESVLTMCDIEDGKEASRASLVDKIMLDGLKENYQELRMAHRDRWFYQDEESEPDSISKDDVKKFAETKEKQRKEQKELLCRAENL